MRRRKVANSSYTTQTMQFLLTFVCNVRIFYIVSFIVFPSLHLFCRELHTLKVEAEARGFDHFKRNNETIFFPSLECIGNGVGEKATALLRPRRHTIHLTSRKYIGYRRNDLHIILRPSSEPETSSCSDISPSWCVDDCCCVVERAR